jgi:hypothetical protein
MDFAAAGKSRKATVVLTIKRADGRVQRVKVRWWAPWLAKPHILMLNWLEGRRHRG